VTDVAEVCWAFSSRVHPEHGAVRFAQEAQNALPVFLEPAEKFAFQTTKVVYDALLADRFPVSERPRRSDLANGWPRELADRVIAEWSSYGYARV
jgi:4-hydroxy-3-polyprenylbenzoate decarboxylase